MKLWRTLSISIALALALLLAGQGSAFALVEQLTLDELTAKADSILIGEVTDIASYQEGEGNIYTLVTLSVEQTIKGESKGEVAIRLPGGEVDGLGLWVEDVPSFQLGERTVVFLEEIENAFKISGWYQGKFTVQDDRVVERDQSLTNFMADISQAMEAQGITPKLSVKPVSMVLESPVQSKAVEPAQTEEFLTGWQNIMTDGFEGAFPGTTWSLDGTPTWDKESYRAHTGTYSVWCAGSSYTPPTNYPNNMSAWMVYGPFSLVGATDAELNFWLWLESEYGYDYVTCMASTNGINFYGTAWSGDLRGWQSKSFDLTDIHTLGNLCGQSQVWIAFIFTSDDAITYDGAFIDDVVLQKYVPGVAPTVTTNNATNITTNSATINGNLSSKGTASTVYVSFEYGLTTAYGSVTTPQAMTTTGLFNFPLTGLSPNTTYHFRAKAVGNGTSYGLDKSFTTSQPDALSVTTNNATNITTNSATLNGTLNNLGTAPTVYVSFDYGLTTAYGSETTPQAMTTTGLFNFPLTGLSPNTTYHFRAMAVGDGTSYGLDKSFTTSQPDALSVTTNNATNITTNSATLNGNLDNLGTASTVHASFEHELSTVAAQTENPYLVRTFVDEDGNQIDVVIDPGRPPEIKVEAVEVPEPNIEMGINTLTGVPAFDWSYGCSATSAAMLFGYYDRTGYSNMYTGPTNGGVCPMDNSTWGPGIGGSDGECPLSATHQGKDGRTMRGHVDDYWIYYLDPGPDPWIVNGWTEHTHADCTGDFMGTNQSAVGNTDGGTMFWRYTSGDPTYNFTDLEPDEREGCHGMRLFAESRGYNVITNFGQYIKGYGSDPNKGFTFNDFVAEIDAGRPVLIHIIGHTMLGYGYNTTGNIVYIHDTWDHSSHQMPWGGTYSDAQHYAATVIQLAPVGDIVYVSFEYGLTTAYGSETTPQAMTTTCPFNFPLTGLSPNTTYHFRAKAVGDGTSYGLDKSFTTSQDGAATVSIVPSNQTVLAGGSFNIDVVVDSAGTPIMACELTVAFDVDLTATGFLGADLLGVPFIDAMYIGNRDVGEANYGGVRMDGPVAVNGNFVTINFDVNPAASGTYPLVVDATLKDAGGNPIAVVENNGQVNIGTNGRKGDFDGDGDIDFYDFIQFVDAYGSEVGDPNYNVIGDFNDDGDIDFFDFIDFAGVYGT